LQLTLDENKRKWQSNNHINLPKLIEKSILLRIENHIFTFWKVKIMARDMESSAGRIYPDILEQPGLRIPLPAN
jgi:hypothetical protein